MGVRVVPVGLALASGTSARLASKARTLRGGEEVRSLKRALRWIRHAENAWRRRRRASVAPRSAIVPAPPGSGTAAAKAAAKAAARSAWKDAVAPGTGPGARAWL